MFNSKATNDLIGKVPRSTEDEMNAAVDSASHAYKSWSKTTPLFRQQIMLKLQALIKSNIVILFWLFYDFFNILKLYHLKLKKKELAKNITTEQGKTLPDAEGDVMRGLQVVEHMCSLTFLQMGSNLSGIAKDIDCASYRIPLGLTAGICPFNFPAMIPLWMFPVATAAGNTMILKPSEKDPGATMMLVELARQAGYPEGVVNVIHGAHECKTLIKTIQ